MKPRKQISAALLSLTIVGCSERDVANKGTREPTAQDGAMVETSFAASNYTSAPKRVSVSANLDAPPREIWQYVSNHDNLVAYSGGVLSHASVDRTHASEQNGVGTTRECEMPDGSKFLESVVYFRAASRFAYTLEPGNSWGLSDHLGVVTVEPRGEGSTLTIELYFNHPNLDEMVNNMTGMLKMKMLPHFKDKFGGEVNT